MDDKLNVPSFANDQDNINVMKIASLSNKKGSINGTKKVSRNQRLKRIRYMSSVILVSTSINIGGQLISEAADNFTIKCSEIEFWNESIDEHTFLTDDKQHFYYDYAGIASEIDKYDPQEFAYYLDKNMSAHVDAVLQYTPYESLENVIDMYGYKDEKNFLDSYKKQILLNIELEKEKEDNSIGGK